MSAVVEPTFDNGQVSQVLLSIQDITDRKQLEDELYEAANTDIQTQLSNRTHFISELECFFKSQILDNNSSAILTFNCESFKSINESLGQKLGDELLQGIGARLTELATRRHAMVIEKGGKCPEPIVARIGGDEFAMLIHGDCGSKSPLEVAECFQGYLCEPYSIGNINWKCEIRVGVAIFDGQSSAEEFLRSATIAVNSAKHRNDTKICLFDATLKQSTELMRRREFEMQSALENQEFRLHYQPIINFRNQKIEGYEALLRWQHPQEGLLMPSGFIEIAENSSMIVEITEWILRETATQLLTWQKQFKDADLHFVSVNISRRHIARPNFAATVKQILSDTGLKPSCLHLEVTESGIMANLNAAIFTISELRALGVRISLDDFGTGLSSLSCIKDLPIDTVKIDRSFVSELCHSLDSKALLRAIAQITNDLGIETIAEGIEEINQLSMLVSLNIDRGQGYLFSKPLPPEEVTIAYKEARFPFITIPDARSDRAA